MSHLRVKTTYNEEGSYGSVEKKTLYAHHNLSCDYTTFYDHDGSVILSFPDTIDNNIFDAMASLSAPKKDTCSDELCDGVEYMTPDDMRFIERINQPAIRINAEFLFELKSKEDWINKLPRILPEKTRSGEKLIWIDVKGNVFEGGVDFEAAEKLNTYPCRVYRPVNVASCLTSSNPTG